MADIVSGPGGVFLTWEVRADIQGGTCRRCRLPIALSDSAGVKTEARAVVETRK